jgi:2'-5' RNA ligase
MDNVRAFIAIELPEAVKEELANSQELIRQELQRQQKAGNGCPASVLDAIKWVNPFGIHITLKFLGAVPVVQLPKVEAGLAAAVVGAKPFSLTTESLGVFPGWSRPRVLWVGIDEVNSAVLNPLQAAVDDQMEALGYAKEARGFSPHLTLARVRETATPEEKRALGLVVKETPPPPKRQFSVTEISLMRSELSPRGARYSRLAAFTLPA